MKIKLLEWFHVILITSWRICYYNLLFSFLKTGNITYVIQDIGNHPLLDLKIRKTCLRSLSTCYYLQDGSGSFSWFSSSQSPMTKKLLSHLQWKPSNTLSLLMYDNLLQVELRFNYWKANICEYLTLYLSHKSFEHCTSQNDRLSFFPPDFFETPPQYTNISKTFHVYYPEWFENVSIMMVGLQPISKKVIYKISLSICYMKKICW